MYRFTYPPTSVARDLWLNPRLFFEQTGDFARLSVAVEGNFAKDELAISNDLEAAAAGRNEG